MNDKPPSTSGTGGTGFFVRLKRAFKSDPWSREEIQDLIHQSESDINAEEKSMLSGVLEVSETQVREVMVPRSQMVANIFVPGKGVWHACNPCEGRIAQPGNSSSLAKSKSHSYSLPVFRELIREKYGTALMIAATSSSKITGLIMGQIVNERIRNVEQYGRSADFNFTELDMMVSNGYPSWFWEDRGAGGFAIQDGFLRVKTMFKYLGIEAWTKVSDPIRNEKIKDKINSNLLTSNGLSDRSNVLSGLAKKLNLDALNQLYSSLKEKGLTGIELQLKFIETYDSLRDNATMFAHEGRHSLDRIFLEDEHQNQGIVMTEYRGRLSQIAFSDSPKLELANMVNGIGAHGAGKSNQMIVDVLEDWIKSNSKLIQGFNKNMLPISQAYLLTDDQIRTCFREVDPFYINRN